MTPLDDATLATLLDRYLTGEGEAADRAQLTAYFARYPEAEHGLQRAIQALESRDAVPTAYAQVREQLLTRVRSDAVTPVSARKGQIGISENGLRGRGGKTLLLGEGTLRGWIITGLSTLAIVSVVCYTVPLKTGRPSNDASTRTYRALAGQRATITLDDRSHVILAPGTVLAITRGESHAGRVVTLQGEAYFDVVVTHRSPFIVRTGSVSARVLGTAFDVRHYRGDRATQVTVISGRVQSASAQRQPVILNAGMTAWITDSTVTISSSNVSPYTGWTSGRLEFQNTPVPEVLATLSRWYNVQFVIADSTLTRATLTARFDYSTTANMMTALKTLLGVRMTYEHAGQATVVTLRAVSSPHRSAPTPREMQSSFTPITEAGR